MAGTRHLTHLNIEVLSWCWGQAGRGQGSSPISCFLSVPHRKRNLKVAIEIQPNLQQTNSHHKQLPNRSHRLWTAIFFFIRTSQYTLPTLY